MNHIAKCSSLLLMTVVVAAVILAVYFRNTGRHPPLEGQSLTSCEQEIVEEFVSVVKSNLWARNVFGAYSFPEIGKRIDSIADRQEQRRVVGACADRFLGMEVTIDDRVRWRGPKGDNYLSLALGLLSLQHRHGIDAKHRVDFFFNVLNRYKNLVLSSPSDEAIMDYDTWMKWENSAGWVRVNSKNEILSVEKGLFNLYLQDIDKELQSSVLCRFSDFLVTMTQQVDKVESYRRRHWRQRRTELNSRVTKEAAK